MALTLPDRALLAFVAVVGVGAIVAVLASDPGSSYPADSPEGAVQGFLLETIDRDPAALDRLDPELGCTPRDVENAWMSENLRVELVETSATSDAARVLVAVREGDEGLGIGGYVRDESFGVERHDGAWRITDMTWPLWCEGSRT